MSVYAAASYIRLAYAATSMHLEAWSSGFMLGRGSIAPDVHEATQGVDIAELMGDCPHNTGMVCVTRALAMPVEPI